MGLLRNITWPREPHLGFLACCKRRSGSRTSWSGPEDSPNTVIRISKSLKLFSIAMANLKGQW
jgi:hypothetical protein